MIQGVSDSDLNETSGGNSEKRNVGAFNRYFVNIGTIDGMTKEDLVHFLSDISKVKRKFFGDITIQKNCAYFDVDVNQDLKLEESFVGVEIEGRDIRVNRDEQARKTSSPSNFRKKNFRESKRPIKKEHRKGGSRRRI